MTFVIVLFVNASDSKKDPKKAKTEVNKSEVAAPCSVACSHSALTKTAACDPATCTAHKDGKCDPATCTAHKEGTQMECPANNKTTACPASCHSKATVVK